MGRERRGELLASRQKLPKKTSSIITRDTIATREEVEEAWCVCEGVMLGFIVFFLG